jgi:hypothetical protein
MTTTTFMRRTGVLVTSAGVAAALTLLTPVTANAAVHAQYGALGQANANYTGPTIGGDCTLTDGDDSTQSSVANFTHGTKHRSVNVDATFTSTDSASDTVRVKGHLDSKLTLKKKGKDLQSFEMAAGGSVKINHSVGGSACDATGVVAGQSQTLFTEHKKGWFYFTHDVKVPHAVIEAELVNLDTEKIVAVDIYIGDHSHATSRALLKPGRYGLIVVAGVNVGNSIGIGLAKPSLRAKAKLSTTVSGEFKPLKH